MLNQVKMFPTGLCHRLCLSETSLAVPLLIFPSSTKQAPIIFVCARVHPGETCSSHTVNGMLRWIKEDGPEVRRLREAFEIHIVPMVNVDGVLAGNFRTSLSGDDLNRRYLKPSNLLHPVVVAIKKHIKDLQKNKPGCVVFLDLHGHSTKPNVFTYGPDMPETDKLSRVAKYYTKIVSESVPYFKYDDCTWHIPKSKKSTARAVMIRQIGVKMCFTVEASTSCIAVEAEGKLNRHENSYELGRPQTIPVGKEEGDLPA